MPIFSKQEFNDIEQDNAEVTISHNRTSVQLDRSSNVGVEIYYTNAHKYIIHSHILIARQSVGLHCTYACPHT